MDKKVFFIQLSPHQVSLEASRGVAASNHIDMKLTYNYLKGLFSMHI